MKKREPFKDELYLAAANNVYCQDDFGIKLDDEPKIIRKNGGAYVRAWLWVGDEFVCEHKVENGRIVKIT